MTTDKPTCPFCLREMTIQSEDECFGAHIEGELFAKCYSCEIGKRIDWQSLEDDFPVLTAAVMEMRKRDCYETAKSYLDEPGGSKDLQFSVEEFFELYIDRLKAEAKE